MTEQQQSEWREYLKALRHYKNVDLDEYIESVRDFLTTAKTDSGSNPPGPPPPPPKL